jgi:hypothetical protein
MTWIAETIPARSVGRLRRMAMASPARALSGLLRAICGRAPNTATKARDAALLLSRREVLAAQIRTAQRHHRPTRDLCREACSITHDILRRGQ